MRRRSFSTCARVFVLALAAFFFILVVKPGASSAHIPITTKIMFNKEVVRILQRDCASCHHPGGIAFSLETYDDARPWAKDLEYEVLRRKMPLWQVMKGYGDFSNAPQMTIRDTEVLVNWIENGVPEGEAKDLPKPPLFVDSWQLGEPDMILKPGSPVAVPEGKDFYQTVTLPTGLKTDRWIKGIDLKPGDGTVVHSAEIYVEEPGDPPSREGRPAGDLAGYWMPGQKTVSLATGAGLLLRRGSRLILRIHYHGGDSAKTDLSQVGLYFTPKRPAREVDQVEIDQPQLMIAPGTTPQRVTASCTIREDAELLALRPAANPLIVSFQAIAYRPDGSIKVLIWTRGDKWNWAPIYYERRPVSLPKGTKVETTIYFDNSNGNKNNPNSPAKEVHWSSISSDPFCTLMLASRQGD